MLVPPIKLVGPKQREYARQCVNEAPDGAIVTFSEDSRTKAQNRLMWALIGDVSKTKPEGRQHIPDVWKCLFLKACGHDIQFVTGLDGNPFPIGFRSSKLNKAEFADLIEVIYEYGSRHGVAWTEKYIDDRGELR